MKPKSSKFYVYWIEIENADGSKHNESFIYNRRDKTICIDSTKSIGKFYYYEDWWNRKENRPLKKAIYVGKKMGTNVNTFAEYCQYHLEATRQKLQEKVDKSIKEYPNFKSAKIRYGRANSSRVPFKSDAKTINHARKRYSGLLMEIPIVGSISSK